MLNEKEKEILDKLRKTLPSLKEEQLEKLTLIALGMYLGNQNKPEENEKYPTE